VVVTNRPSPFLTRRGIILVLPSFQSRCRGLIVAEFQRSAGLQGSNGRPYAQLRGDSKGRRYVQVGTVPAVWQHLTLVHI